MLKSGRPSLTVIDGGAADVPATSQPGDLPQRCYDDPAYLEAYILNLQVRLARQQRRVEIMLRSVSAKLRFAEYSIRASEKPEGAE